MPFSATLAQAKTWPLKNVAGVCVDSDAFMDLVNEAQRRLVKRGAWVGTEWVAKFTTNGCHVTWPRWVKAVYGVKFCHDAPAQLYNNHYSFVGPHHKHHGWHGNITIEDDNTAPIYNEVTGNTGKFIWYFVTKDNDVGKTCRIYGLEYGGQVLRELVNGAWVDGVTITAAKPFGFYPTSPAQKLVTQITNVVRQATEGPGYLYENDPITGMTLDLASYEPSETVPRYRRSKFMHGVRGYRDANGQCIHTLEALVKLQLVEVHSDRDFLLIDDPEALKYAIQSIKAEEGGDNSTGEVFMAKAIRELNMLDREELPDDQVPVRYNVLQGYPIHSLS